MPVIRDADTMDFAGFFHAYELIRKVRTKLTPDDFAGATVTLTTGTIGTERSVPRLSASAKAPSSVGAIGYPTVRRCRPGDAGRAGLSKVITISSTYDHRIIQGAESGLFLAGGRAAGGRRRLLRRGTPAWASPTSRSGGPVTASAPTTRTPSSSSRRRSTA
ncbi:MAG: 2-oxo acid dehydrogenase subunit E2 [Acidimicrobiales bacterium]